MFRKDKKSANVLEKEEWQRQVDFAVELFRLNPELPEVVALRDIPDDVLNDPCFAPMYTLQQLNPHDSVVWSNGVLVVHERLFGHVLQLWSIVRHHIEYIDDDLDRIVADGNGTHLYRRGQKAVTLQAGAINPTRLADPGNRYEIALEVIREFTGLEVPDWHEQVGSTQTITAIKADNAWDFKTEPALAG